MEGTGATSRVNSPAESRRLCHWLPNRWTHLHHRGTTEPAGLRGPPLRPRLVATPDGPGRRPWTNPALVPQLSTVIDMLEGAFYGLDLLKLHSVTTRLVGRVDKLEEVRATRAFHAFVLIEPKANDDVFSESRDLE